MNRTRTSFVAVWGSLAFVLAVSPARAADPKPTPEMEAMMKKAMALGTPGPAHQVLEPFIGKWSNKVAMWMKPGEKPKTSEGTTENAWILNGRFVKQNHIGTWEGQPFTGIGLTGYDNLKEEYQNLWIDSMMTGMMTGTGVYDAVSKTVSFSGTFSCPMTGEKARWYRSEWKVISDDKHTYTSYDKGPDGKEFKSMEIVYTRVK